MDTSEFIQIVDNHRVWLLSIGVYGKQADFRGVDLKGIDFQGVDLSDINLEGAKNVTAEQLCKAKSLCNVRLAPELEKQAIKSCPHLFNT